MRIVFRPALFSITSSFAPNSPPEIFSSFFSSTIESVSTSQGKNAQNSDPSLCTDSKPTLPPIASAIALQIESPSPVPWANSSSFSKRWNTFPFLSSAIPIPVSFT